MPSTVSLEILDLSWNSFGVRGAKLLSAGLKEASSLAELYLAWAGIGDEGASHVVQALVSKSSIKALDLSGNGLSVDTCMVLGEVMQVGGSCRG